MSGPGTEGRLGHGSTSREWVEDRCAGLHDQSAEPLEELLWFDGRSRGAPVHAGYANLIELAYLTGARWGELAELRVKDVVDRDTKSLLINRSRSDGYDVKVTKSRRERLVPLTSRALTVLAEQSAGKSKEDLICLSPRGKRLNRGNFERAIGWKAASSGHRFHDLRHTAATRWIRLGIDIKTVSVWLGPSDSAITHRKYVGWLTDDATASALEKLERAAENGE